MTSAERRDPPLSPHEAQARLWQAGAELALASVRFMSAATAAVMSQAAGAVDGGPISERASRGSGSAREDPPVATPYLARGAWQDRMGSSGSAPWPFDGVWQSWLEALAPLSAPATVRAGSPGSGPPTPTYERLAAEAMIRAMSPWVRASMPPMARAFVTPWLPEAREPADVFMQAWADAVMTPVRERWIAISLLGAPGSSPAWPRAGAEMAPWLPWSNVALRWP